MRPQFYGAVVSHPQLAIGTIDDRRWIRDKAEDAIFSGQLCLQQGQSLAEQRSSFLAFDDGALSDVQNLARHPLFGNGPP